MGRYDNRQTVSICIGIGTKDDYVISQNTESRTDIIPSDDTGWVLAVWSVIVVVVVVTRRSRRHWNPRTLVVVVAVVVEQCFDSLHNDRIVFHQTKNKRIRRRDRNRMVGSRRLSKKNETRPFVFCVVCVGGRGGIRI